MAPQNGICQGVNPVVLCRGSRDCVLEGVLLIDTFNMFCKYGDVVDVLHGGGAKSTLQEAADELKTHISSNFLCRHVLVHE